MVAELEAAGLPPSLIERSVGHVPLHAIEHFLERLTHRVGVGTFLFRCLDTEERSGHATVASIPLPQGMTGLERAQALTAGFDSVFNLSAFSCEIDGPRFWILRKTGMTDWTDYWPTLQYNMRAMLSGMRQLFGQEIQPVALRLDLPPAERDRPQELRGLPVVAGRGAAGLAFPFRNIAIVGAGAGFATRGALPPEGERSEEATAAELAACMVQYLETDPTAVTSSRLAKAFGMSERSYRRHLAVLGTSHRQLLDNARLETAFRMLADPTEKVTEIAYVLGYTDSAHFTRFFKQRVGLPPSEYRRPSTETSSPM
jgi:AraC-like DNA-binding protein